MPTKMPDEGTVTDGIGSDGRSLVMAGMTVRGRPSVEPGRMDGTTPSEGIGKDGSGVVTSRPPVPEEPIMNGPSIVETASPLEAAGGAES
jgi:hypothetical protein